MQASDLRSQSEFKQIGRSNHAQRAQAMRAQHRDSLWLRWPEKSSEIQMYFQVLHVPGYYYYM